MSHPEEEFSGHPTTKSAEELGKNVSSFYECKTVL